MKLIVSYDTDVKTWTKRGIHKGYRIRASWADVPQGLHGTLIKAKMNTEIDQLFPFSEVVQLGMALALLQRGTGA